MAPRQCDVCNEQCASAGDGRWERLYERSSRREPTAALECDGCQAFLCGDAPKCALAECPACANVLCAECYGRAGVKPGVEEACAACADEAPRLD